MKKILFVAEAMGGGVFTYLVDFANELCQAYEVYIAYAIRPQTPDNYREYFDERVHLIEVKNFTRSINPLKDVKALFEIKKIRQEVNPDIIHLHSSKAGALGRFAYDGNKFPLFYTPHGYSFLMENYNPIKRALFKAVEIVCAKKNCTTVSCSYGEHQETQKLTNKARYVDNGINVQNLERMLEKVSRVEHPFTVFTLGRICYQKNPKLFNRVAESMPEIKFLWIGDGELKGELKSQNIEITGWVDRAEALNRSVNADVFLLTSLWEGMPISLLESMYMRKLCVVNDVIGNHDVIESGRNGFVCRTIDEFTRAILEERTETLIEEAYEDIMTKYNAVVMAKKYVEIYERGTQDEYWTSSE